MDILRKVDGRDDLGSRVRRILGRAGLKTPVKCDPLATPLNVSPSITRKIFMISDLALADPVVMEDMTLL